MGIVRTMVAYPAGNKRSTLCILDETLLMSDPLTPPERLAQAAKQEERRELPEE